MTGPSASDVAAVFDRAAATYDEAIPFFARFGERLVALADIAPGTEVLDVASGRGASLLPAVRAVGVSGRVVGVDMAPAMVELLRRDLGAADVQNASVTVGDATQLEFGDAAFDVVLCGFTLMLLPEPERAVAEMRRVVRPGGRVVVSMPTGAGPEWAFMGELAAQFAARAVRPLPPLPAPPPDLGALLRDVGLADVTVIDEVEDFAFANADVWWRWVWSQGMRAWLEVLPDDALAELRAAAVARLAPLSRPDGSIPLHQGVRYARAVKPR